MLLVITLHKPLICFHNPQLISEEVIIFTTAQPWSYWYCYWLFFFRNYM